MIKIEGNSNLSKDLHTGAILLTNMNVYKEHLAIIEKKSTIESKIESLENSIVQMNNSIEKIIGLLEKKY